MNTPRILLATLVAFTLLAAAPVASAEPGPSPPCFFFGWCADDDPEEAPTEFIGWLRDELSCTCPPI